MADDSSNTSARDVRIRPGESAGTQGLTRAGVYERRLRGSVERLLENALDWEHLPWLHASSFTWITRFVWGGWGWRARVGLPSTQKPQEILLELLLDRDAQQWVSRVLEGPGAGNEIWSRAAGVSERECDVFVEFHLAGVEPERAESYGKAYERLYARLYDEDEAMMMGRQAQLDRLRGAKAADPERLVLGTIEEIRACLPLAFEFGGAPFRLVEWEGELIAHSTVCPHFLGPLDDCGIEAGGIVTCPWHGCLFDVVTGKSADQNDFCLHAPPTIELNGSEPVVVAARK